MKRGYDRSTRGQAKLEGAFDALEFREGPSIKKKKLHQLSSEEVFQVIDAVKVDKLAHREVGIKFGICPKLVSRLIVADRKRPDFRQ